MLVAFINVVSRSAISHKHVPNHEPDKENDLATLKASHVGNIEAKSSGQILRNKLHWPLFLTRVVAQIQIIRGNNPYYYTQSHKSALHHTFHMESNFCQAIKFCEFKNKDAPSYSWESFSDN